MTSDAPSDAPSDSPRPSSKRPISKRLRALYLAIPVLVAVPALIWHASDYLPYMSDDSLIVARYAERLIEGHGLTWTDGERVEGYSDLLWVLSVAAVGSLGVDLLTAARVLGVLFMSSVLVALSWAYKPKSLADLVAPSVAGLVFASAAAVAVWTIGGLEQPLLAGLLAWALVAVFPILDGETESKRRALLVGIPLGLLCWTRPDGPLFTAVFAGVTVMLFRFRRTGWILGLRMAALPVLAVALQLGFRLAYYGDWLPNPAYMKARLSRERLSDGIEYILGAWEWMLPALVLAGLSLVVSFVAKHQRGRATLLLCCFVAWSAYVTAVGGDIFAGWRHTIPLWVLLAFAVALGLDWARHQSVWLLPVVVLASFPPIGWLAKRQREEDMWTKLTKTQDHQWEGEILGRVLGEGFDAEQPLIAVTAAGTIPYFSKLPALDMLGLNDRHIARQTPDKPGYIGHDHADGEYVLDREPDLILFHLGGKPAFRTGKQIARDPRFRKHYQPVYFRGYVPHERGGKVYVRTRGRVGVQVDGDTVTVPAYLLGGAAVVAQPGVDGGIDTVLPANASLMTRILPVGPGTWRVTVEPPNPYVDARLRVGKQVRGNIAKVAEGDGPVRVRVTTRVGSLLGSLRIERVPERELAAAKAVTEPATTSVASDYVVEPFGTFDDGLGDWRVEGVAFAQPVTSSAKRRQLPVTGNVGPFLNSYTRTRKRPRTGLATSPSFRVSPGAVLSFRIGGGNRKVGVRLMDGAKTLVAWHGDGSEELRELRFALSPYEGRTLHVEVFDDSEGSWGHVIADEFALLQPARAR